LSHEFASVVLVVGALALAGGVFALAEVALVEGAVACRRIAVSPIRDPPARTARPASRWPYGRGLGAANLWMTGAIGVPRLPTYRFTSRAERSHAEGALPAPVRGPWSDIARRWSNIVAAVIN
jgi:hypothetical protein